MDDRSRSSERDLLCRYQASGHGEVKAESMRAPLVLEHKYAMIRCHDIMLFCFERGVIP
jgi:hypothetical protein